MSRCTGILKHGNLVVRMRIPYLKLEEPAEKFIERKMTTPAAMPATEPEPVAAQPARKPVRSVQKKQEQAQQPAAVNEQTPFFE